MVKCSFCGDILKPGTGKMFVLIEGKALYFCTMKCEKNMLKLKRKPYETRWTKLYKKAEK
ncbi:50S ribosomal protein L24e [Candidatus Woesearchaeota archaeon]|nr:50S ribosomal protein L24e [Candidatus Woesearchaeota archaeon]